MENSRKLDLTGGVTYRLIAEVPTGMALPAVRIDSGLFKYVLLKCTEYPCRRVAAIPMRFWYHLANALHAMPVEDPARARLGDLFAEPYAKLARLCAPRETEGKRSSCSPGGKRVVSRALGV